MLLGKAIGETVIVKKTDEKGNVSYRLKSSSSVNMLFQERSTQMEFDVKYTNGTLHSSFCKVINNGEPATTEVTKMGNHYQVKRADTLSIIKEPIVFSSMELYFSEPVKHNRVFSERMGEFASFVKTGPAEYTNKVRDVTNTYRYKNGKLYEVEIRKPLGSVYLRAKQWER